VIIVPTARRHSALAHLRRESFVGGLLLRIRNVATIRSADFMPVPSSRAEPLFLSASFSTSP